MGTDIWVRITQKKQRMVRQSQIIWRMCRNFAYVHLYQRIRILRKHDDVIKWKHSSRYWPFVRGIHLSPVNSPHKMPMTRSFDVFYYMFLNKWLSKQSKRRWFETLSRPSWRHCNGIQNNCPRDMSSIRSWPQNLLYKMIIRELYTFHVLRPDRIYKPSI